MRGLGAFVSAAFICSAGLAVAEGKSIIVLDGSGSMWGQIDGRAKLEIAREALAGVLAGLPAETELGLMAYGHREKGNCGDIELMVAPAAGTASAISAAANGMQFLGKTPLTEAVRRAAAELRSTEEKATVILITDGIETCEADPCALGTELEASGIDFTAHVVGFGLSAEDGRKVACLAENTGGTYIEAKDAGGLIEALQTTVAAAPEPAPTPAPEPEKPAALVENFAPILRLVAGGPDVGAELRPSVDLYQIGPNGARGDHVTGKYDTDPSFVDQGRYLLVVNKDAVEVSQEIEITAEALAQPEVILDAGYLTVRPLNEAGGEPVSGSPVDLRGAGGITTGHYGLETRLLPSGEYEVAVRIGEASAKVAAVVEAGQNKTLDVIVSVGRAVINTYYTPEMIMENIGQSVEIFEANKALDGNSKRITGGYGAGQAFILPPGDYVVVGDKDEAEAEIAFTVKPNEQVDVAIVLNAGVLATSAPGARGIEVFKAKKNIQGNRTSVRYDYGDTVQTTLPAGDYVVEAERDGVKTEGTATVIAGERTEITIP